MDYVMETYREGTEIVLYVFHAFLSRMKWERGGRGRRNTLRMRIVCAIKMSIKKNDVLFT